MDIDELLAPIVFCCEGQTEGRIHNASMYRYALAMANPYTAASCYLASRKAGRSITPQPALLLFLGLGTGEF